MGTIKFRLRCGNDNPTAGRDIVMQDRTSYLVVHDDETRAGGSGPTSPIPTLGAATSAVDQYRTAGIHSANLPEIGAAFTDVCAVAAISKIAEGGVSSHAGLEAAEAALQALLLHDVVHVVTHAPKIDFGNGLISYRRLDDSIRTQFGFDLFALAQSRDFLIAPELVRVDNGSIVSATFRDSPLLGRSLDSLEGCYEYWSITVADAINAAVAQHGIPAYLTDPLLTKTRRGDGFAKLFYHRLNISWNNSVGGLPPVICTFNLPPLLAIVLDRLTNRQDLARAIADLREELRDVRRELRELNEIVTMSARIGEVERRVRHVTESFDAILPESSLSGAQRFQRRLAAVQRLVRPIIKFMAEFVMKTGPSYEEIMGYAQSVPDLVVESRAVVDRTVTAKTFAGLVQTDPLQSLVNEYFNKAEIDAIERSLSRTCN